MATPKRKGKHRRIISIAAIVGVVAVAGLVCYGLFPQRVKADLRGPIRFDTSEEGVVDNIEIYKDGELQLIRKWDPWWYSCYVYEYTSGEIITVKFNLKFPWVLYTFNYGEPEGILKCHLFVVDNYILEYPSVWPDGLSTTATFENLTVPQEWNDADCHHLYWDADTGVVEWLEY